ncbi:MAG: PA14 domain-containing protein [Capsulimonadaceae bacterium]
MFKKYTRTSTSPSRTSRISPDIGALVRAAIVVLSLAGSCVTAALGDPAMTASLGIGGHYREGGWIPVTVSVSSPAQSGAPVVGQVQALANPPSNPGVPYGVYRPFASMSRPSDIYAAPLTLNSGAGRCRLYIRDFDPIGDNMTVQFAGGAAGDGPILSSISVNNSVSSRAFQGTPVADTDVWVVGLAGDPAAFSFLSGRHLQIEHGLCGPQPPETPGFNQYRGSMMSGPPPATVQAGAAGPADLPERSAGYDGVDVVAIRDDAPLDALSGAQVTALRDWVASGGRLLIVAGTNPSALDTSALSDMFPASINLAPGSLNLGAIGGGTVSAALLTPGTTTGVRVLASALDGNGTRRPAVVTGPFGAGTVTVVAFDATAPAFRPGQGEAQAALWRTALTGGESRSNILPFIARDEKPSYYGRIPLSSALLSVPAMETPAPAAVAAFLLVYILFLVPVNYLVLKRLDRREWAWVTIPCLVMLFSLAAYAVGYASKGGQFYLNRISVLETTAGSRQAGLFDCIGAFSPRRGRYDLAVRSGDLPSPASPIRSMPWDQQQNAGPGVRIVQGRVSVVHGALINMWSMRAFNVSGAADLGGPIRVDLAWDARAKTGSGTVTNLSAYTLRHCTLYCGPTTVSLGDLTPGARGTATGLIGGMPRSFPASFNSVSDGLSAIQDRLLAGTGTYFAGIGIGGYNYRFGGQDPGYEPGYAEAILTGWINGDAPGETIEVDGSRPSENRVSLVIVHIPMELPAGVPVSSSPMDIPSGTIILRNGMAFTPSTGSQIPKPFPPGTILDLGRPNPPPVKAEKPSGSPGLLGLYYYGNNFGRLVFKRIDPAIDFDWTNTGPGSRMPIHAFSVRWLGKLIPRYSERYTIMSTSDDGVRVYLNGTPIISNWSVHAATENVATVDLVAGRPYDIKVEYFEKNGRTAEIIRLYWTSLSQPLETIPTGSLRYSSDTDRQYVAPRG